MEFKVGDEVFILDTAREVNYDGPFGYNKITEIIGQSIHFENSVYVTGEEHIRSVTKLEKALK